MKSFLEFYSSYALISLLARFLLNFAVTGIIIVLFYYKKTQRRDFLFTFFMVSTTIFMMVFLLDNIKIQVGFALGLFAIFGILRYRTDTLPVREMTYLFSIIGISVINALCNHKVSIVELVATNVIFIVMFWVLEYARFIKHTQSKTIVYEKIELIKPSLKEAMLSDLKERTGLQIISFEVGQIDFLKDTAVVKIYYPYEGNINTADNISKYDKNPIQ
jgi:hypothetical protein